MARRFDGQVAWVTGAGSGIGRELALELARRGAAVGLSGRRRDRLEEVATAIRALGGTPLVLPCDVTDEAQVQAAVDRLVAELGGLDLCIANAGFGVTGRVEKLTAADWRRQLEVNVVGLAITAKAAIAPLRARKGRLALLGSAIVYVNPPGNAAYSASKAAVHALGQTLYAELARDGIAVTTIHPGFVASEIGQVDNQGVYDQSRKDPRPARLIWPTDKAARKMLDAVHSRRREAVITGHGKLVAWLGRHLPWLVALLLRGR